MTGSINFRKMNGLGNEFVVFDARRSPVRLKPEAIEALGGSGGIGFDQMITIEMSTKGADLAAGALSTSRPEHPPMCAGRQHWAACPSPP